MFSFIFFLSLITFILWMNGSKKIGWHQRSRVLRYVQGKIILSRWIMVLLCSVQILLCIQYWGLGAGIFSWIVLFMTAGGFCVLLFPLHYLKIKPLLIFFLIVSIVEFILRACLDCIGLYFV